MNLRDRIENNLTVWLLSTLTVGFLAGIGAYKAILEIAQLDVIAKVKLEQLQQASHQRVISESVAPLEASPEPSQMDPTPTSAIPQEGLQFSSQTPPFPEDYDSVRPGMRFSEARVAFPNGDLREGWYAVNVDSGHFSHIAFYTFSREAQEDPVIDAVVFYFRDEVAKQAALTATLREYGAVTHRSETLGAKLVWPILNGFKLTIDDDSFNISPPEKN
jgi:hypothetical protein